MTPATGQIIQNTHLYPLRVYYEDTDQQGIVFYANYLKYFERGRTEFLRHLGAPRLRLKRRLIACSWWQRLKLPINAPPNWMRF